MRFPIRALTRALALGASALLATGAQAAGPNGYPTKPVSLVVPFAPGGGSDNIARFVAGRLAERTGAVVLVDNRPGAGTNIGNELVKRAPADGYTLLFGQVTLAINPYVYKKLPYNVRSDFTPVAHIANSPSVLLVPQTFPEKDVKGLVQYGKKHPGMLNYGSGGTGTSVHLAGQLFASQNQVDMVHVPYRGSSPAMTDLIGGQIQAMFDTAPSALPHVKGGKVRALAVTGPQRVAELPDVPTFAEAGYADFDAPAWYGVLAPAGTPPAVVSYLNQEINAILAEPATVARLAQLGSSPVPGTPEAFGSFIAKESDRWKGVIQRAGIQVE
jgi:tripartite-type tricarboxylate transporter receptor subunit TctC